MNSLAQFDKKCSASSGDRIKIYPDILVSAARGKNGGAAKLWTLAKHANRQHANFKGGCGSIPSKALRQYVINELKIKRGTYDQWLIQALHIKLLEHVGDNLKLAGLARAAVILGTKDIKGPAYIPVDLFIKKGWLSWVWRSWLEVHKLLKTERQKLEKPISRMALRELSGISERAQVDYEKKAGVINHAQYAKDTTRPGTPGMVDYINEFERAGKSKAFLNAGEITWRIPNTRETNNKKTELAPKGRSGRANRQLHDLLNISGRDHKLAKARLYNRGEKQTRASLKKNVRQKNRGGQGWTDWIYQAADIKGFWHAIPA